MASRINMHTPYSSKRLTSFSCPKFPSALRTNTSFHSNRKVAAEKIDNLDHLQLVNHQQPQTKKVAPTVVWDGFPTARTVQQMDSMERMMEDPFTYGCTDRNAHSRRRTPRAIKEGEREYKMMFDMPGMKKNDVKVWIEENMLVVKAEKVPKTTQEGAHEDATDEERTAKSYGKYSYSITLPENLNLKRFRLR